MTDFSKNSFFDNLVRNLTKKDLKKISIILVSHVLPDKYDFFRALYKYFDVAFVIPKPKSIDKNALKVAQKYFTIEYFTRNRIAKNYKKINKLITKKCSGNPFVIMDVGGYFASIIKKIRHDFGEKLIGIIEDTENGYQRYEELVKDLDIPIYSVARSPLKKPEDYHVGQSIVFSTEYLLRANNDIFNSKKMGVIGYGKIGESIAKNLYVRNLTTYVADNCPLKKIDAFSDGFNILSKKDLLKKCDIIFCATGSGSLNKEDFKNIKSGAYIASVTSSDDEMKLRGLSRVYRKKTVTDAIEKYISKKNYFYLLNKGDAVNFLHNAVVGKYIYLVQSELIAALVDIFRKDDFITDQINQVSLKTRKMIAETWIKCFI